MRISVKEREEAEAPVIVTAFKTAAAPKLNSRIQEPKLLVRQRSVKCLAILADVLR